MPMRTVTLTLTLTLTRHPDPHPPPRPPHPHAHPTPIPILSLHPGRLAGGGRKGKTGQISASATNVTMHTCKKCSVQFRAKVGTKLPKHGSGSRKAGLCGGRCLGGKGCKGCP